MERLRAYFYGKKPHNFFPFSFDIALSDIEVFKIGGTVQRFKLDPFDFIILFSFPSPCCA